MIAKSGVLGLLLVAASAAAQIDGYSAQYTAQYKGRNIGESVFSLLENGEPGHYVFTSTTRARGLARLAAPNPVVDRSEFSVESGQIKPRRFSHEDGSRKGDDNHTIEFDWDSGTARVAGDGYNREIPLNAGVLDRGSLQAAMVVALRMGKELTQFAVLDEQSIDEYAFEFEGRNTIDTPLGKLETLRYKQQRAGSSRYTMIDLAPALNFVPARIEQIRDGEAHSAFYLEALETP